MPPTASESAASGAAIAPPPQQDAAAAANQTQAGPLPPLPSQAPRYAPSAGTDESPPASQWVQQYADGEWVYTSENGWIWVPAGAVTMDAEGVPYTYLYTPASGWTWYLSPWGWGPYHYGPWVRHTWRPSGWHGGWVAHPHVVVRLGGHGGGHGHGHR